MSARRTRWIRWARESSKRRRQIMAQTAWRRTLPPKDIRRWACMEGFPGGVYFHAEKPNPFYGRHYPYAPRDGYLRWMYRTEATP